MPVRAHAVTRFLTTGLVAGITVALGAAVVPAAATPASTSGHTPVARTATPAGNRGHASAAVKAKAAGWPRPGSPAPRPRPERRSPTSTPT